MNDIWEYNITTDTWTQKTSGATPRYHHSAIHYNDGQDKMIIFGGYDKHNLNDIWEYNMTVNNYQLVIVKK